MSEMKGKVVSTVDAIHESILMDSDDEALRENRFVFKKRGAVLQESFGVNFQESNIQSDWEKTCSVSKPNQLFRGRQEPAADPFNNFQSADSTVSETQNYEETTSNESLDTEASPFVFNKSNPFHRADESQTNAFGVNYEQTKHNLSDVTSFHQKSLFKSNQRNIENFVISYSETNTQHFTKRTLSQETDDTTITTLKNNPFKKPAEKTLRDPFDVEFDESTFGDDLGEHFEAATIFKKGNQNDRTFDVSATTATNKTHDLKAINMEQLLPSEEEKPLNTAAEESKEIEEDMLIRKSLEVNNYLTPGMAMDETIQKTSSSVNSDENSKENIYSESYMDQSSFNDENLKCWMSDHSEEKTCSPSVPSVPTNLSGINQNVLVMKNTSLRNASLRNESFKNALTDNRENRSKSKLNLSSLHSSIHKTPLRNTSIKEASFRNTPIQKQSLTNTSLHDVSVKDKNKVLSWEEKFNHIVSEANKKLIPDVVTSPKFKKIIQIQQKKSNNKIKQTMKKVQGNNKQQRIRRPAPYVTKRLCQYLMDKLKPRYGIDSMLKADELILSICDTVKTVLRRNNHQKKLITDLKVEMAKAGVIETTIDFYEFIIKFLPHPFRIKVIPCVQPVTNTVYPPREVTNPFDKII